MQTQMQIDLDLKQLRKVCLAPLDTFFGKAIANTPGATVVSTKRQRYTYIDRGANVLGVAHCDTVSLHGKHTSDDVWFEVVKLAGYQHVLSRELDDRLGVYIMLYLLPQLGINVDVLLTDDEEIGMSTAYLFEPPHNRQYNWCFSFDRRGTDVAMYQYKGGALDAALTRAGFTTSPGSFSDICSLDHLGVDCANFGVGYANEHSQWCSAAVDTIKRQVARFAVFWRAHANTRFNYVPKAHTVGGSLSKHGNVWYYGSTHESNAHKHINSYGGVEHYCYGCDQFIDEANFIETDGLCILCDKQLGELADAHCTSCGMATTLERNNQPMCDPCQRQSQKLALISRACVRCGKPTHLRLNGEYMCFNCTNDSTNRLPGL